MHHSQERKFLAVGSAKSCEAGANVSTTWRFYVSWHSSVNQPPLTIGGDYAYLQKKKR